MNRDIIPALAASILCLIPSITLAQTYTPANRVPVADNSLGTNVTNTGANNFNITGGLNQGQTLFHSFSDFSVPTGGAANFINSPATRDIITRVTGTNFSDINGLINSNGANFFLINPNGVTFGTDARLNVGKAFMATTANGINLVDAGGRTITFGTNASGDAPLLSVDPNVIFNVSKLTFGGGNGQINNFGTLQTTNDSQYIGLVGGNVNVNGGKIIASGGRVDIGGLNGAGTVGIGSNGLVFDGSGSSRSDVTLANGASISVRANQTLNPVDPIFFGNAISPGSSINLSANRIEIKNSGTRFIPTANNVNQDLGGLDAGLAVNSGTKTGTIGNITLDATGDITIQKSAIINLVRSGAEGTGGGIKIAGNNITVTDKAEISTNLSRGAVGKGGNIEITALGNFSLFEPTYLELLSPYPARPLVTLPYNDSQSVVAANSLGRGDAGKVTIAVRGDLLIRDRNAISSTVEPTGVGSSAGIKIDAGSLTVSNGSQILSSVDERATGVPRPSAKNNAGNIDIKTTGDITIRGSNTNTLNGRGEDTNKLAKIEASNFRTGDVGKISIATPGKLSIVNRGAIFNGIRGNNGNGVSAGIQIDAGEVLVSNLSSIFSFLGWNRRETVTGSTGDIVINATGNITLDETLSSLIVKEFEGSKNAPSTITNTLNGSVPNGTGTVGKIIISTPGKVTVGNHNVIGSTVEPGGEGNPGGISINAGELEVYNEGQILTVAARDLPTLKTGNAGNIDIKTTGNITVAGNRNSALPEKKGELFYAKIASSSFRNGNAGKITIDAGGTISLINKGGLVTECADDCRSQVLGNKAGNITINSKQMIFDRGDISLNAIENAGDISIVTRDSILMRRNSSIGTNSRGGGNGGNITINSPFIIAVPNENSDITASAVRGRGGNVNINSQGVFGIQFRPLRTSFSDIIVSSDFGQSGTANIDTLGKDPGRDSTELPNTTLDASNQIAQTCSPTQADNKLYIIGRGGLPPDASEPQESEALWQDAREPKAPTATTATQPQKFAPPAVGWVFVKGGKVRLLAAQTSERATTKVACPQAKSTK